MLFKHPNASKKVVSASDVVRRVVAPRQFAYQRVRSSQKAAVASEAASACDTLGNAIDATHESIAYILMNRMPGVPAGGVVTEKGEFERAKSLRGIQLVELRLERRGRDGLGDEAVEEAPT